MRTPHVSISNAVNDWIQDSGLDHGAVDEVLLKKWATDVLRWISSNQNLKHRVALLQVENYKAKLPDDFKLLAQAAANPDYSAPCDCTATPTPSCCGNSSQPGPASGPPRSRREDLVQWVQGSLEKECELEINLICPACHETKCTCGSPVVEVDVDRIWEQSHPEIYYRHFDKIGRFGNGPGPWSNGDTKYSYYSPKFKLMKWAGNDFFQLTHFLTKCPNVDCKGCSNEFQLDLPYIEVDFEKGELLISYLGIYLDENGEMMIPDHPDVFEAIFWHLEHKYLWREYRKTKEPILRQDSQIAKQEREQAIGMANGALDIPEFAEFKNWLDNQHYKRTPNFHHHENLNKTTRDVYERYSDKYKY